MRDYCILNVGLSYLKVAPYWNCWSLVNDRFLNFECGSFQHRKLVPYYNCGFLMLVSWVFNVGISHYNRPIIKIVGFSTCLSVRAFLALNMGFLSSKNGPYYNYGSLISKGGSWVFNVGLSSKTLSSKSNLYYNYGALIPKFWMCASNQKVAPYYNVGLSSQWEGHEFQMWVSLTNEWAELWMWVSDQKVDPVL